MLVSTNPWKLHLLGISSISLPREIPYNLPWWFFFWNCPIDHPFHLPLRNWSSCTNFLTLPIMFAKYKSGMQMVNYMPSSRAVWYTYCIVIVHYTITSYYCISGHTITNKLAFLFCRHGWYSSPTTYR